MTDVIPEVDGSPEGRSATIRRFSSFVGVANNLFKDQRLSKELQRTAIGWYHLHGGVRTIRDGSDIKPLIPRWRRSLSKLPLPPPIVQNALLRPWRTLRWEIELSFSKRENLTLRSCATGVRYAIPMEELNSHDE
jgi:hypothetical protein